MVTRQLSDQAEKDLQQIRPAHRAVHVRRARSSCSAAWSRRCLPLGVALLAGAGHASSCSPCSRSSPTVSVFSLNLATGLGLGPRDRLQPVRRLALPRRARAAACRRRSRSDDRCRRRAAPSRSARAPSRSRSRRWRSSRFRTCARSRTRASRSWPSRPFAAIVVLPAVLAVLGPRVEQVPGVQGARGDASGGVWGRQADRVMRHPCPYAVGGQPRADPARDPVLPPESRPLRRPGRTEGHEQPGRHRSDPRELREPGGRRALGAASPASTRRRDHDGDRRVRQASSRASRASHASTRSPASTWCVDEQGRRPSPPIPRALIDSGSCRRRAQRGTYLSVVPDVEPLSSRGRAAGQGHPRRCPRRSTSTVAGLSARLVDTKDAVISRLPLALGLDRARDVRAAVPDDRQPARAGQGAGAQHALAHRDVRRDGLDLPGGPLRGPAATSRRPAPSTCSRRS